MAGYPDWTQRTELLLGTDGLGRLAAAKVAVVGVGGVGSYAAEMLVRAGVGHIVLIDSDVVSESNINRQLPALHSTVGCLKVEVLGARLLDINPELDIRLRTEYLSEENIDLGDVGFVVDAIDTLSPKVALIRYCLEHDIRIVSSMGSGSKLDATAVRIADIYDTYECPLARMIRKRLRKFGVEGGFPAVFSPEKPVEGSMVLEESRNKRSQTGTISYMPAVFGCACAQAAVSLIAGIELNC